MSQSPDPLADLKDFQRATAVHAFSRMYDPDDPATHFLIADEVGLGKTMVARGVIAQAVDHLKAQGTSRIDVVYVCSNAEIARQNIARLRGVHGIRDAPLPDRITMLPLHSEHLAKHGLNFFSFTPGTSLDLKSSEGTARERAMLVLMLRAVWGDKALSGNPALRVFQGQVRQLEGFARRVEKMQDTLATGISAELVAQFAQQISVDDAIARDSGEPELRERYDALREAARGSFPEDRREERRDFIAAARRALARACVAELEPDLVILDEFQRFGDLLHGNDPASQLAHDLFGFVDPDTGMKARVLLLSATPYKMFTTRDEASREDGAEDHYSGFIQTVNFLLSGLEEAPTSFPEDLRRFREALYGAASDGGEAARQARSHVERLLRRVMCRTERLAVTDDRNGMLSTRPVGGLELRQHDVESYLAADAIARRLDVADPVELWKSAPYLATFLDGYTFDQRLEELLETSGPGPAIAEDVAKLGMPIDQLDAYDEIDGGNPRMRALTSDVLGSGMWRLLWMPPALPYYEPGGPFAEVAPTASTKRLIFSSWNVVPRAVASMLSYEAERRIFERTWPELENNPRARRPRLRLPFTVSDGRPTGMPVLALVYPSHVLAQIGAPLGFIRATGAHPPLRLADLRDHVRGLVEEGLRGCPEPARGGGPVDERWYWAVPLLLDYARDPEATLRLLESTYPWAGDDGQGRGDPGERFADHLSAATALLVGEAEPLGPRPADLVDATVDLAIASPAACALRSLTRIVPDEMPISHEVLTKGAAGMAWGIRALFNSVDTSELVRGEYPDAATPYWRHVLRYCLDGNLQAVLDEYVHVLPDLLGVRSASPDELVREVASSVREAATLRTARTEVRALRAGPGSTGVVDDGGRRMRNHFAVRLRDDTSADDGQASTRSAEVRRAFNSPFWPFVLASTSVGQEGLDFHVYCHCVVHWNLPYNPVDLEQREGRVHRFKGHAIRKNVARLYAAAISGEGTADPWEQLFEAAVSGRPAGSSDLVPFWIQAADGGATIERIILAPPLSRDVGRARDLRRALAIYRLAFGQPRQEDLLAYLDQVMTPEDLKSLAEDLRIDLAPA